MTAPAPARYSTGTEATPTAMHCWFVFNCLLKNATGVLFLHHQRPVSVVACESRKSSQYLQPDVSPTATVPGLFFLRQC
uniref:Uncharacterized protein n=1 Tax=Anopheles merus TaxID=30066 RepID=A0A182UQB1_ANOME